jgi:hypothetical protein
MMRTFYREEPLAINMPMVAWGGEGRFRKYGWRRAAVPRAARVEADEDGRVLPTGQEPDRGGSDQTEYGDCVGCRRVFAAVGRAERMDAGEHVPAALVHG